MTGFFTRSADGSVVLGLGSAAGSRGVVARYLPGRRQPRIDPISAMRCECTGQCCKLNLLATSLLSTTRNLAPAPAPGGAGLTAGAVARIYRVQNVGRPILPQPPFRAACPLSTTEAVGREHQACDDRILLHVKPFSVGRAPGLFSIHSNGIRAMAATEKTPIVRRQRI